MSCLPSSGDQYLISAVARWRGGVPDFSELSYIARLYIEEALREGCGVDERLLSYIASRIKGILDLNRVKASEEEVLSAVKTAARAGVLAPRPHVDVPRGRAGRRRVVLSHDVYIMLQSYVGGGPCAYLERAVERLGTGEVAVLLRSWGVEETCDEGVNRVLKELAPWDTADLELVVEDGELVVPGAAVVNVLSRAALYQPIGMVFVEEDKWRIFSAVAQLYESVKRYPIYIVDYQWQNWRRFTSFDVAVVEGYAVDMSAEGLGEGCGVAYKTYSPAVFAHELIHCAQQAEGRVADRAAMELEAHSVERLVMLAMGGDETARKIAEAVRGGMGSYIASMTVDGVREAFAGSGVDIAALNYTLEGVSLKAIPAWAQYYRGLGELPPGLTMLHNIVHLYAERRSPLLADVLLRLFSRRIGGARPRAARGVDLSRDVDFLREYAYFAAQYQRGRLLPAHVASLTWLGFSKALRELDDYEKAKSYVAAVLREKLKYTATAVDIDTREIKPPEILDILRDIPQLSQQLSRVQQDSKHTSKESSTLHLHAQSQHPRGDGDEVVELTVADVEPHHVGGNVVLIPSYIMEKLKIRPGDYVAIAGKKVVYAQAQKAYTSDEGREVIRMDYVMRQNLGVKISDTVKVKRAVLGPAVKVVLVQKGLGAVDAESIRDVLLGKAVYLNQKIEIPFRGGAFRFLVTHVEPNPAYVSHNTEIVIQKEEAVAGKQADKALEVADASAEAKEPPDHFLMVADARPRDVGRSIVRVPVRVMKKLGIEPGDYVEIIGRKSAYAQVWPAYPEDEDKEVIRMDGIIRQNAGVGIGDTVKVRKAVLKAAQRVVLAPTEPVRVDPEYLKKQILLGKPVARGQAIDVPFYGGAIRFVVVHVYPDPAYISIDTQINVQDGERDIR
ncbi:AAA family ATPase [Pyrobaculum ferrireducens]|uniref:AAA family ATPase n=1 Tax=Pyrobaculum ferrireducens TaxID=1104324 RepID=G7VFJ6_9CREN|nr:ATPase AAA [Pyrobaculum ferrireducens]AET34202.1 AAA family ATPase [Pyrobaculum ferrireducens]